MQRQILIKLQSENDNDYESAFNIIQKFKADFGKLMRIGFSANVGQFGGFITDDVATWQAWLTTRNAERLKKLDKDEIIAEIEKL
jgi:hypothetical protein